MSTKRLSVDQILRTCEDQGCIVRETRDGYRILPQDKTLPAYCFHRSMDPDGNVRAYENMRAGLRRIGVIFPEDAARQQRAAQHNNTEKETDTMSVTITTAPSPAPPPTPVQRAKTALTSMMNAMAELDSALADIERDQEKMQQLRTLLRGMA